MTNRTYTLLAIALIAAAVVFAHYWPAYVAYQVHQSGVRSWVK